MKEKNDSSMMQAEIFLVDPATPSSIWEHTGNSRPGAEEWHYALNRFEKGKCYTFFPLPCPHVLVFAPKKDGTRASRLEKIRVAASDVLALLESEELYGAEVIDSGWEQSFEVLAFMEGLYLGSYRFGDFKKEKPEPFSFALHSLQVRPEQLHRVETLCAEVNRSRHLVDLPFMALNAARLADWAAEGAAGSGIKVKVWTEKELSGSGMGGLLGVNQGSIDKPSFTEMEYKPSKALNKKPVVLVGKGVVFDAGGMNIKTGRYMEDMKTDMAGAAVAMGIVRAAAALRLPVYLKAFLPATDNRLNGNALVCGDVLTMYDGTTVEVTNTDAEGRLILADAVAYACKKHHPELIVTIATLTGAASRALGPQGIAAMQEGAEALQESLLRAGEETHERLCFFPMWEEYGKELKSGVADMKNCSDGPAGMITAAKFIHRFAGSVPFLHLDVAGVEFLSKRDGYRGPGATACGIRLMVSFLQSFYGGEKGEFPALPEGSGEREGKTGETKLQGKR